ncbi:MAG TPA: GAF domain-containing protein, partial [Burkholderiales bacterium]|nr:GAF domain-containing protein [Burkholderiales bacterium]
MAGTRKAGRKTQPAQAQRSRAHEKQQRARHGKALAEALKREAATAEVLQVISRAHTDAQPVFEVIVRTALKLCRARSATVFSFDGKLVHIAALANATPEGEEAIRSNYPRPPGRDNAASRAVLTRKVVTIPDVLADPEYAIGPAAASAGFRSVAGVPLLRHGRPIGAIAVGRSKPGPWPDKLIDLLKTFADQAVIAIENVR